jgi:hypothetical protein
MLGRRRAYRFPSENIECILRGALPRSRCVICLGLDCWKGSRYSQTGAKGTVFFQPRLRPCLGYADHPVPAGIFTLGIPRMMILCRRATRFGFTCGLKTVRGLGIIAERNAASRAFRFAAGL